MKRFKVKADIVMKVKVDESDITEDESAEEIAINLVNNILYMLSGIDDYYISSVEEI